LGEEAKLGAPRNGDFALVRLVSAVQQVEHRRFSAAVAADQGRFFPFVDFKGYIGQNELGTMVFLYVFALNHHRIFLHRCRIHRKKPQGNVPAA